MAKKSRTAADDLSPLWNEILGDSPAGTPPADTQPKSDPSIAEAPTGSTPAKPTEAPPMPDRSTAEVQTGNTRLKSPRTRPKSAATQPKRTGAHPRSTAAQPKTTKTRPKRTGVSLRIPANILQELNTARNARPVPLDRHTWILEAIHEKAARDLRKKA